MLIPIRHLLFSSAILFLVPCSVICEDDPLCKFVTEKECTENWAKEQCPNSCLANDDYDDCIISEKACTEDWAKEQCPYSCLAYDDCLISDGFFKVPQSNTCYKIFNDQQRTWSQADQHCKSLGLQLAEEPLDAVILRKYIVDTYGSGEWHWMGGRGNGRAFEWQQSGGTISRFNRLWLDLPDLKGISSSQCLMLATDQERLSNFPSQPYWSESCETTDNTLCEVIMK